MKPPIDPAHDDDHIYNMLTRIESGHHPQHNGFARWHGAADELMKADWARKSVERHAPKVRRCGLL